MHHCTRWLSRIASTAADRMTFIPQDRVDHHRGSPSAANQLPRDMEIAFDAHSGAHAGKHRDSDQPSTDVAKRSGSNRDLRHASGRRARPSRAASRRARRCSARQIQLADVRVFDTLPCHQAGTEGSDHHLFLTPVLSPMNGRGRSRLPPPLSVNVGRPAAADRRSNASLHSLT
jgi:hypothetical protein